ncbi:hypothetical protein BKG86_01760 [Mycobacteroides chelonae]|uniref:hypothetical protein n=1 Tax=Mycobacteroides chelonae TaxID=1774 RepID=UPI0008A8B1D8|nr:hypothetical protein [Mycobacteroides chelonae]OHU68805.1 hypothetical protein BKG86_01760 [Mycobacteroides chelonae]
MKYTANTILKAVGAFGIAFAGAVATVAQGGDVSTLDLGGWMTAIGSGVVAAGALFSHPVKADATPAVADVTTSLTDAIAQADAVGSHLNSMYNDALGKLSDIGSAAAAAADEVRKTIGGGLPASIATKLDVPGIPAQGGSLIDEVIRVASR